jgi:peptidoglycan/LPS O-acetylase OafA/YrhL
VQGVRGKQVAIGQGDRTLGRMPALDGLRTFAVVLTSLVHLVPGVAPGGIFGVDLFFVLSGFLITSILLQELGATGRLDLASFYVRRARRLLPAVVALLIVYTVVVLATSASVRDLLVTAVVDVAVMTYTFNWTGVLGHDSPWQVDHLWSLSVEEQFYILWPVALVLLAGRVSRRTLLRLTLAGALASSAAQTVVYLVTHSVNWAFLASPLHAQGVLLGCCLGQVFVWRRAESGTRWLAGRSWPAWLGLALMVGLTVRSGIDDSFTYVGGMALAVLASAVLVWTVAAKTSCDTGDDLLTRLLSARWMVALGRRSYSIYLWQNFVAWTLTPALRHTPWWVPANVVVTLLAAEASLRLVERRFLHGASPRGRAVRVV